MPHVKSGKLKALASTGAARLPALPDVPTFSESGVPLELDDWFGAYTTSKTPVSIVTLLHGEITRALSSPELKTRFGATEIVPSTAPAEAARKIAGDVARWEKIVKIPSFANALK
jgi:tripartite-type tricarboxylate transporter receptor subunit TctC